MKNSEGEVIKFVPVRVTTAHSLTVTARQDPDSKQLMLGHTYDIDIQIYNKDERPIYPSPVSKSIV